MRKILAIILAIALISSGSPGFAQNYGRTSGTSHSGGSPRWKAPVNNVGELPTWDTHGSCRVVLAENAIYEFNGTIWVKISGSGAPPAPVDATYITQIPDATLSNEQALSVLPTGVLMSTTGTGVVSIAAGTDIPAPGADTQVVYNNSGVLGADAAFTFNDSTGDVSITGQVKSLTDPTDAQDAATKSYVDALIAGLHWLPPVLDRYDPTPGLPLLPDPGDRYMATATANGWTDEHVYECVTDDTWAGAIDTPPDEGYAVFVEDEDQAYVYVNGSWVLFGYITGFWNRVGTTLEPRNLGDSLTMRGPGETPWRPSIYHYRGNYLNSVNSDGLNFPVALGIEAKPSTTYNVGLSVLTNDRGISQAWLKERLVNDVVNLNGATCQFTTNLAPLDLSFDTADIVTVFGTSNGQDGFYQVVSYAPGTNTVTLQTLGGAAPTFLVESANADVHLLQGHIGEGTHTARFQSGAQSPDSTIVGVSYSATDGAFHARVDNTASTASAIRIDNDGTGYDIEGESTNWTAGGTNTPRLYARNAGTEDRHCFLHQMLKYNLCLQHLHQWSHCL